MVLRIVYFGRRCPNQAPGQVMDVPMESRVNKRIVAFGEELCQSFVGQHLFARISAGVDCSHDGGTNFFFSRRSSSVSLLPH
jgi:hypothetical protein